MPRTKRLFQLSVLGYLSALVRLQAAPLDGWSPNDTHGMLLAALGMTAIVYLSRR